MVFFKVAMVHVSHLRPALVVGHHEDDMGLFCSVYCSEKSEKEQEDFRTQALGLQNHIRMVKSIMPRSRTSFIGR